MQHHKITLENATRGTRISPISHEQGVSVTVRSPASSQNKQYAEMMPSADYIRQVCGIVGFCFQRKPQNDGDTAVRRFQAAVNSYADLKTRVIVLMIYLLIEEDEH